LRVVIGVAALAAPALHSVSDVLEWYQGGFSAHQLWLNYVAFLPMPWLLLGIYVLHRPLPSRVGLYGALLYGVAFTYFAHTTLYALAEQVPDYAALWGQLGHAYTVHGALMVLGGLLFGYSVLRAGLLPRLAIATFLAGITANLVLSFMPVPEILQAIGSAIRNLGLAAMGYAILRWYPRDAA
jgi:hypothetical protein